PEGASSKQAPEIELPLAPGKPQGTGHAVEVLTDGGEVAALTYVIREKRQHTLRQGWRRRQQVIERGDGAQGIEVPCQGREQHALIRWIRRVDMQWCRAGARHVGNGRQ